jgi:hypothetical protein
MLLPHFHLKYKSIFSEIILKLKLGALHFSAAIGYPQVTVHLLKHSNIIQFTCCKWK